MRELFLEEFTEDNTFPFHIQFGRHYNNYFPHSHMNFIELGIVTDGSATHTLEQESYRIQQGDVFIINSHLSHNFTQCEQLGLCNIMFHPYFLSGIGAEIKQSIGFHTLFSPPNYTDTDFRFNSKLKLSADNYRVISSIVEEMNTEYREHQDGWKDMICACFSKLVIHLSRCYEIPQRLTGNELVLMTNALSYMDKHFTDSITLKDLAQIACVSERHFTRLFLDTFHTSPIQYILTLRLKYACNLLKNTSLSITDISTKSGFSDHNYFSRKFKHTYNLTPSEMRKAQH